ncbi:MAG: putative metalloprotease CJM1_0395 family protein [Planctomycetota bacterium]
MDVRSLARAGSVALLPTFDPVTGRVELPRVEVGVIAGPDGDRVTISGEARRLQDAEAREEGGADSERHPGSHHASAFDEGDRAAVRELEHRDREVRQHERAHQAAAGGLASGGAAYTTEVGPDGKHYATGGEVQIRLQEGRTPEETVQRMQQVRRAALAPAQPSPQDLAVAAEAARIAAAAQREEAQGGEEAGRPGARRRVDVVA